MPNSLIRGVCVCALGVLLESVFAAGCGQGSIADPSGGNALNGSDENGDGTGFAGTAASGGAGSGGGGDTAGFVPAAAALRKLTVAQYQSSVRDLFGDGIAVPTDLEADTAVNGFFSIGAAKATVSPVAAEKLEKAAYELAAAALTPARRDAFVGCVPSDVVDDACTTQFVTRFGRRAFRRPLSAEEITRYTSLAKNAAQKLSDFHAGLEFAVAGFLQSPAFVFRAELGETDPNDAARRRYTDYEMASRLSYTLWNTTPDDALLDAADSGELVTSDGLRGQIERLLASDRLKSALDTFHSERLGLADLQMLTKDPAVFAGMNDALREAMRQDVLRTIEEHTFGAENDFRSLFDTRVSFVNAGLAQIYELPAPSAELERALLPQDGERLGLLGKAAYLALEAHDDETSPTKRGKAIRERFLCQSIPAPPPNVVTVLPEPDPNAATMRERLAVHASAKSCNTCHSKMDPLGLPLEHFDTVGRYREDDNGHALDVTGDLDGTAFDGARALGAALHDDPRTMECVVRQAYRYAVAHVEEPGEEAAIADLTSRFEASGYKLTALLEALVESEGFRFTAGD